MNQLISLINHYSPQKGSFIPNFISTITSGHTRAALLKGTGDILFRVTYCETCHKTPLWIFWHLNKQLYHYKIENNVSEIYLYDVNENFIPYHYLACDFNCRNHFIHHQGLEWHIEYDGYLYHHSSSP